MTNEDKIALHQLISMLKTGELHGGSIRQRVQFLVAIEHALAEPSFTGQQMLEYGNERVDKALGRKFPWECADLEKELVAIKSRVI